ncbi:AGAP012296-PA-like protein [Anopheles sinensis]|uniref:AGAP012296-PA-like protein n=1 Tax=Anopheles sinensis TaxID=74873 RepID=A0A084WHV9_ANOSI|nr:AGAP012296-PA-like protein [Anopheles sinensis]
MVFLLLISALVLLLAYAFYGYVTKNNKYFEGKPIPCLPIEPLFGSTRQLLTRKISSHDFMRQVYDQFSNVKIFGLFDLVTPVFLVRDPELIKRIAVKDFDHFVNHRRIFGSNLDPDSVALFAKTLFALTDQQWRDMRATLSPAFTGSKMRQMFELIGDCSAQMVEFYRERAVTASSKLPLVYDVKEVFSRFGTDVIATCAFGLKVDSFRDPNNSFYINGKKMVHFERFSVLLKVLFHRVFPWLMEKLQIDLFDREQNRFFIETIRETLRAREAQGIVRPDMVHLLMQARKGTLKHHKQQEEPAIEGFATVQESDVGKAELKDRRPMSEMELVAQCLIFFLAGFDTVSNCLTFLAYELALNPDVQERLHAEILAAQASLQGKPLSYDVLQRMKYMDMVVSELLRKWPPGPSTDRICTRDYVVNVDGMEFTIDNGTSIFIPISGLHHDPQYYPEPEKFDPERFSEENKHRINLDAYLPFGVGPRNCIGSRFALMEVKAVIYHLLLVFSLERVEQTEVPVRLKKGFVALTTENGVHLGFKLRDA